MRRSRKIDSSFHDIMDITLLFYKVTEVLHNMSDNTKSILCIICIVIFWVILPFFESRKQFIISIASPTFSCLLWWQKVGRMKTNLLLRICKNIIHGIIVKLRQKWKPMIYRYSRERILTVICYGSKMERLIYVRAF